MLRQAIRKNSLLLGVFALCTAGLLAATFELTKTRIADSERRAAQKALLEVVPTQWHDNDMLSDVLPVPADSLSLLGLNETADIHIARKQGQFVAAIIPAVAPDGYSGDIRLIVGIKASGEIAGVRVLSHNETPGLGDKVDLRHDDWILSFAQKSLHNPLPAAWRVKKDGGEFDQFTGATITPRAVVAKVYHSLQFFQRHRAALMAAPQSLPIDNLQSGSNDE